MATEKVRDFAERLREFRASARLSQEAMGKKLGISGDYVYQIEKGLKNAGESLQILFGLMESSPLYESPLPKGVAKEITPAGPYGFTTAMCEDQAAFAMGIVYDSMAPTILPGDLVVVTPSEKPRHGDIVGAKHRAHGEMVRIYSEEAGNLVRLSSLNSAWRDLVDSRESFEWIYPVHSLVRNFRKEEKSAITQKE